MKDEFKILEADVEFGGGKIERKLWRVIPTETMFYIVPGTGITVRDDGTETFTEWRIPFSFGQTEPDPGRRSGVRIGNEILKYSDRYHAVVDKLRAPPDYAE